ncbi:MAG: group 1 truncated hemoglobin [Planctomycetes bacterium]|nr:group 1 truncated hemoglobin [Planctomycetota bacterium]
MTRSTDTQTLFEKLGGAETVRVVVDAFYAKIQADESLAPFFADTDWKQQKSHQAAFIGMALGGPKTYAGKDMVGAHEGRGIGDEQFDAVAGHLVATLQEAGVEQGDIDTIVSAVAPLRADVVGN